jgi:hypothetical protein
VGVWRVHGGGLNEVYVWRDVFAVDAGVVGFHRPVGPNTICSEQLLPARLLTLLLPPMRLPANPDPRPANARNVGLRRSPPDVTRQQSATLGARYTRKMENVIAAGASFITDLSSYCRSD